MKYREDYKIIDEDRNNLQEELRVQEIKMEIKAFTKTSNDSSCLKSHMHKTLDNHLF